MHRARDVLDLLLTEIVETVGQLVLDLDADRRRDADTARLGERLEPCGDVDPVAVNVVVLDDDVAEVDADPERDAPVLRHTRVALGQALLHLDRALHRLDHARELDQRAIAHQLDDAAVVLGDLRFDEFLAMRLERCERARLVGRHEPRVADHVRSQNRCQPALHCRLLPAGRDQSQVIVASMDRKQQVQQDRSHCGA